MIESVLGCLKNLLLDCTANRMKVLNGDRWLLIVDVAECGATERVREEALGVLKNLWADAM